MNGEPNTEYRSTFTPDLCLALLKSGVIQRVRLHETPGSPFTLRWTVDEPVRGSRCNGATGPRRAATVATVTRSETRAQYQHTPRWDQKVRTTAHASHYCESCASRVEAIAPQTRRAVETDGGASEKNQRTTVLSWYPLEGKWRLMEQLPVYFVARFTTLSLCHLSIRVNGTSRTLFPCRSEDRPLFHIESHRDVKEQMCSN